MRRRHHRLDGEMGAMFCSRLLIGKGGRTGIDRRRGRTCDIPVIPCGEVVEYLEIREHKEQKDKGVTELREGIWLGHARQSNETIIGTPEGVVRAYDVRRKAEGQRWNSDKIKNMRGTPQQPDPSKPGMMIPMKVRIDKANEQDPKEDTEVHETETRRM